jgi:hypothetical protein
MSKLLFQGGGGSASESTITEATTGLLYELRMTLVMMSVEQQVECLAGESEVNRKAHMTWPGLEPGSPRWDAND